MIRGLHRFLGVLVILSMLFSLLPTAASAAVPPDGPTTTPSVAKLPPVAIGSTASASKHERAPREDLVQQWVRGAEAFPKNATAAQVQAAVDNYYAKFYKRSGGWTNPKVQAMIPERERQLASGGIGPAGINPIQPVTATVLSLAVQFDATETISMSCLTAPVVITGPMQGEMMPPAALDNNTVWYSPTLTANPEFYEDLAFGYEGIGRVRMDLTDPNDGLPGINLAGYTVQDYYDHVAGDGNVAITGTFQGWVTVPHSEGYYGAWKYRASDCTPLNNDGGLAPVGQVAVDALKVFSATYPTYYTDTASTAFWKRFDANGDGYVDAFWVVHAGAGEESGGGAQGDFAIWSHSWALSAQSADWANGFKVYEGDPSTTADDIYVDPYTVQPENLDLGVLVEEFGHNFFALPDLYTVDAQNSIGFWTQMGAGSWAGPLGGSVPVGMPLWFRMIAWCGAGFCNWQEPMVTRGYQDAEADVVIGQLEKTPAGVSKGVLVNLPSIPSGEIPNLAGAGNAAWSGTGVDNARWTLDRQIAIGPSATGVLSFTSYWDLEEGYDFGYVMVNGTALSDTTSFMVRSTLGPALNNTSETTETLSFDLSAYKGTTVTLRFLYRTDSGTTWAGWWIDNLMLDGAVIDNFTGASGPSTFPGWVNSGFLVVPGIQYFASYYLVEWRADTKYDKMVRTAYVTTESDTDLWRVERVPYNVPAALLYYRNEKYPTDYYQRGYYPDSPSFGPKNKLLLVDMNYQPMRLGTTPDTYLGALNPRASSYDAGLTLQGTAAVTLSKVLGVTGGPWPFPFKPAVNGFNDVKGYYAGFYVDSPCPVNSICFANRDGSAVIPARNRYSSRVTDFYGSPYYDFYGSGFTPSWLGSGNPGDDAVQYGVVIDLLSKASSNITATLRFKNQSIGFVTNGDASVTAAKSGTYTVSYQTVISNTGFTVAHNVGLTYTLDSALTFNSMSVASSSAPLPNGYINPARSGPIRWSTTTMNPGDAITVTLVANGTALPPPTSGWLMTIMDGTDGLAPRQQVWWTELNATFTGYTQFLPLVMSQPLPWPGR
jgi:immune inhibitor A